MSHRWHWTVFTHYAHQWYLTSSRNTSSAITIVSSQGAIILNITIELLLSVKIWISLSRDAKKKSKITSLTTREHYSLYYAISRNVNVHYIFVVVNVPSFLRESVIRHIRLRTPLEVIKARHNCHLSDLTSIPLLKTVGSKYNINKNWLVWIYTEDRPL